MRTHGKVTPELRRWIVTQTESGRTPEVILEELIRFGWPEGAALDVMERALTEKVAQIKAKEIATTSLAAVDNT